MQLKLYSRTTEVGGRQVKVHEMTETEIDAQRFFAFLIGIAVGASVMLAGVLLAALTVGSG